MDARSAYQHQFEELSQHAPRLLGARVCCHCGKHSGVDVMPHTVAVGHGVPLPHLTRGSLLHVLPYRDPCVSQPQDSGTQIRNAIFLHDTNGEGGYAQGFVRCETCERYSFWSTAFAGTVPTDRSDHEIEKEFNIESGYRRDRFPLRAAYEAGTASRGGSA